MPAIVTIWLTISYLLTSEWLTQSMVSKILHRKHFVYDSELWEGRGPDLGKIHTFSRFLESVPFDMYSETDFGSEKSIGNIFLSVFKSLKFSLQYEILNLEIFCKSMELTMLLLLTILTFTFKLP